MRELQSRDSPQITSAKDARITRVGRVLRRYKLDELPQLINVVLGDMSLVGPRPEVPKYVDHYPRDLRDIVLSVRPGITDAASLEYRDEELLLARAEDPNSFYIQEILPRKLKLSAKYIERQTLYGDIGIILKTFVAMLLVRRSGD